MKRTVLITGASTGLGLSLSEKFLATGDVVYGVTKTKRNWLSARRRLASSKDLFLYRADVRKETAARQIISRIYRKAGRIDILINNAGYANRPTRIENETLHELRENVSSNLFSTFLMSKYVLPIFKRQGEGWIINIASMAGKRAVPLLAAYSASKFGVLAITQSIVKENPEAGFKCVAVCPGGMNTKMREKVFGKEDAERQQSPDFVAGTIMEILDGKIEVPSGGDILIRHGAVTAINPLPEP